MNAKELVKCHECLGQLVLIFLVIALSLRHALSREIS